MAQELDGKEEAQSETARIELAVRQIERDPTLRFLVRTFLRQQGLLPLQSPFNTDVVQSAFDQGRQAAALDLIAILTSAAPMLWPALQIEEMTDVSQV